MNADQTFQGPLHSFAFGMGGQNVKLPCHFRRILILFPRRTTVHTVRMQLGVALTFLSISVVDSGLLISCLLLQIERFIRSSFFLVVLITRTETATTLVVRPFQTASTRCLEIFCPFTFTSKKLLKSDSDFQPNPSGLDPVPCIHTLGLIHQNDSPRCTLWSSHAYYYCFHCIVTCLHHGQFAHHKRRV